MMAAAAVAAGAFFKIFRAGQAAQFERLGDLLLDGFLDLLQFFLRVIQTY